MLSDLSSFIAFFIACVESFKTENPSFMAGMNKKKGALAMSMYGQNL